MPVMLQDATTSTAAATAELISPTPPFSLGHGVVLVVAALVTASWILLGQRAKREGQLRSVEVGSGMALVAAQLAYTASELLPANFAWVSSLPLHVCDMGAYLAGVMLLLPDRRWIRSIVFFWGLALTTQAFVTPTVKEGLATPTFWFYWIQHWSIVAAALWAWFVDEYRPTLRDLMFVLLVDLVLLVVIVPLNIAMSANYMWLGDTERDVKTLLDYLGPWPGRILVVFGLAHLIMLGVLGVCRVVSSGPRAPGPGAPGPRAPVAVDSAA